MKELPHSFSTSAALGWAFLWRNAVLVAVVVLAQRQLAPQPGLLANLIAFALIIACGFVAAHWLRARGFGSVKIILVEWADYQQFKAGAAAHPTVQPDGPASGGSAG